MTTNVYDITSGFMTSDSRWSYEEDEWVVYVDDTRYEKIVFDSQLGILFAGDMATIDVWKTWFKNGRIEQAPLDATKGISLICIDMISGEVVFSTDYLLTSVTESFIEAWYGGSGSTYAKNCWQFNKCAKKAVSTAIENDYFSGGTTLCLDRSSIENNIVDTASVTNVATQLKERGFMMNKKFIGQAKSIKDAANDPSDVLARNIAQKVMAGKAQLSAPFPGIDQPWTNEKKEELAKALGKYSPT